MTHTKWHSTAETPTYSVSSVFNDCWDQIRTEYGSSSAWNKIVPLNGTESLSLSNFDLKGWPLPVDCSATLGGALNYSHSAYFVLNTQDPNLPPKTWGPMTSTIAMSSSSTTSTNMATITPSSTTAVPTSAANRVTNVASATPTIRANTVGPSRGLKSTVSKGAIAGATIGGIAIVGLGLAAFIIRRRHRARRVEERQKQVHEAKDCGSFDASLYWKPEMPTDHQPQLLHEMPLDRDPGYSLAPYEIHNVDTQEMPTAPGPRASRTHEMPATPIMRR